MIKESDRRAAENAVADTSGATTTPAIRQSTGPATGPSRGRGREHFPLGTALLVALAVFAIESTWMFYDAQVPPLVQQYVGSAAVIGLLMGMDNVIGIFVQPWIGNRSDRTRTRLGRRIPYLLALAPLAA
ncbi:MAG TPA: hypothetical protein VIT42_03465, partial [Microlunatus sp.]